ncbi:FAD:protein FMN transferase [Flavobacterium sp. Fl-77]|uniref:FAD:protein FMN transferase n=1 Tax=Flavobacterium flavipigmentatum TaxID=2893884 RepID=A0AAJ2SGC1_9FLAO|nr:MULTISPECIES: FAD:protein FMN transferase [unclassified Flavobacterium]MDX6182529.1 FAD:protein FMN transferase [Flavobacterium sp. Fl-33]MDX6185558.1 FAD:protein FMN transferase [Flavobacterium sp. Fl-77]UFH38747.1 FAD:protein FMN transferase [Flavobacterium sp. F-70]
MGNNFTITVVAQNEKIGNENIQLAIEEIRRIEKLLTTYKEDSQTNLINQNAGIGPVKVDAEVFNLIERCLGISRITQGAFDISYGSIDKSLWNFDQSMTRLPDAETALKMVHLIDYRNIILDKDNTTVFLKEKGMRIGFGGIGKGYAAEMAKQTLLENHVESGIINASGDLSAWGMQPNGKKWTIGVADPDAPNAAFSYMEISNKAVATSGNYEKFVTIQGKKYSHTIDPKTGLPITGIKSVTIIASNAEFADAMATPIAVMGIKAGLYLIDQIPDLYCIIIDDNNKIYTSKNINLK